MRPESFDTRRRRAGRALRQRQRLRRRLSSQQRRAQAPRTGTTNPNRVSSSSRDVVVLATTLPRLMGTELRRPGAHRLPQPPLPPTPPLPTTGTEKRRRNQKSLARTRVHDSTKNLSALCCEHHSLARCAKPSHLQARMRAPWRRVRPSILFDCIGFQHCFTQQYRLSRQFFDKL